MGAPIGGLWRKATKARPASWRAFAEAEGLPLPDDDQGAERAELERAQVLEARARGERAPLAELSRDLRDVLARHARHFAAIQDLEARAVARPTTDDAASAA